MRTEIEKLLRPNIRELLPYSSAREEYTGSDALFLDANESPFNSPYNRYPDPHQKELKRQIAMLKGVTDSQIFVGNGSDEAIDILFRIFCTPEKDNVVSIHPTYGMYKVCADINHVELRKVLLREDFSLDPDAIIKTCDNHTKILFLCSPNNPTSNSFDPNEMLDLAESLDIIVVVDEAYIDFSCRESMIKYLDDCPNLVVLQTFSKAWALAGIRLGIALGNPELIHYMGKVKYPYNVNFLTQNHALGALKNKEQTEQWIGMILRERDNLTRKLQKFRFVEKIYPSDANFLLVRVSKPKKVYHFLVNKKIVVRDRSNVELCEGSLRITVGSEEENSKLTEGLMQYQRDFVDSCSL